MRLRLAAVSAASLLALTAATGVAAAQPATGSAAPSAVVLSVTQGEYGATVTKAATLSCAPVVRGTHPDPKAACAALAATTGDFDALVATPDPNRFCPMHYDPVTAAVDGVWQGERVAWKRTFSNACVMAATLNGSPVFAF
ncbi:SSI family serine proteinase inhibitor [Streptomyces sp. DH12]|uniref:SSI family serine proteinase inhibitor n=1 Tax=Streptomyces sp. DH12 TaxID=2857010 RepID=UPI001E30F256|nr:SSI family serine proteinase inhibitor [Streptomyces sp. DH12]